MASEHVGSLARAKRHKEADRDPFNAKLRKRLIVQLIQVKDYVNARAQMEDYVQRFPADSLMRRLLARVQSMGQPK
jgi:TolA-binding protein